MGRRKSIFGFLLLLAILLTACTGNNSNGITAKKINGLPADTPTHLSQKLGKHVNLDADVIIPEGIKKVPVLKASIDKIGADRLNSVLIGNLSFGGVNNPDGSTQEIAPDSLRDKNGKPMRLFNFGEGQIGEIDNNKMLIFGASQIIFMSTEYNYTFLAFQRDTTSGSYSANLYKKTSLPFMSPDKAFNNVEDKMKALGFEVKGSHKTYCLDHQTSSGVLGFDPRGLYVDYVSYTYNYLNNKFDWDTYDDYYYFVLYPKYHGIPIAEGDGSSIEGGTLDVAYCERGIEYLMANTLYKETGILQSDVPVYGLDDALQMLKYKYDNTILTEPVTVSSIRFCYIPVPMSKNSADYRLVPGWQFTIKKTVTDVEGQTEASNFGGASAQTDTINVYFDATTGKEIIGSTPRL